MNSATAVATFQEGGRADVAHADVRQGASASQHRSRGSGTTEQVSESAPELLLVNARLVLALVSALACGVMTFSSITPPPCRRLRRLQFVQALPLLSGDEDYRAMTGPDQSYRPAASLHFVGDCLQVLGVADWLLFHTTKYVGHPQGTKEAAGRRPSWRCPGLHISPGRTHHLVSLGLALH